MKFWSGVVVVVLLIITGCGKTEKRIEKIKAIQSELLSITQTEGISFLDGNYVLAGTGKFPVGDLKNLRRLDFSLNGNWAARFYDTALRPLIFRTGHKRSGVEYHILHVDETQGTLRIQKSMIALPRGGDRAVLSDHEPLALYRGSSLLILDRYRKSFFEWALNGTFRKEYSLGQTKPSQGDPDRIIATESRVFNCLYLTFSAHETGIWKYMDKHGPIPLRLTRFDLQTEKKKEFHIDQVDKDKSWHAFALVDNGREGVIYIPASLPSILFLDHEMRLVKELDLAPVLKEAGLNSLYEQMRFFMEWGDVYRISPDKMLILFPYVYMKESVTPYTAEGKVDIKKMNEADSHIYGDTEKWRARFAVLVDTKKGAVLWNGDLEEGLPTHKMFWALTSGFADGELIVGPDADYLLYLLKNSEPTAEGVKRSWAPRDDSPTYTYVLFKRKGK